VMGPAFNFLFSVVALSLVWTIGFSVQSAGNRILLASDFSGQAAAPGPADKAGLQDGDRILSIEGAKTDFYFQIQDIVSRNPEKELSMRFERGDRQFEAKITPYLDKESGMGRIGIYSFVDPIIASVDPLGPAARSGLKQGDLILAVDGKAVNSEAQVIRALDSAPTSVKLTVQRALSDLSFDLYPDYGTDSSIELGFSFPRETYRSPRLSVIKGIIRGTTESALDLRDIFLSLGLLFRNVNITNALAGPARIVTMVGDVTNSGFSLGVKEGITSALGVLSVISLSLLLTNLLPIPLLDGGLIIIFLIEAIRRKQLRPRTLYRLTTAGFLIVAAIFLFSVFNDILFYSTKR
jgi:regulator of sigma E protease